MINAKGKNTKAEIGKVKLSNALPPVRPSMVRSEYLRGFIASANVINNNECYDDEDVWNAVLRVNDMETANCVTKDTFRMALRWTLNYIAKMIESDTK